MPPRRTVVSSGEFGCGPGFTPRPVARSEARDTGPRACEEYRSADPPYPSLRFGLRRILDQFAVNSSGVSPRIRNCLFRFVAPAANSTCDRFSPSQSRSSSVMAWFARPSSGGAVTATFKAPGLLAHHAGLSRPRLGPDRQQAALRVRGESRSRRHFFFGSRTSVTAADLPATTSTSASLLPRIALYLPASTPLTVTVFWPFLTSPALKPYLPAQVR